MPIYIVGFDTLAIAAISDPAIDMLTGLVNAIPEKMGFAGALNGLSLVGLIRHVFMFFVMLGAATMAGIARFAILGLVLAMGPKEMGLGDEIINMAFGLTLGGIAVAFALSFGLGGREAAGKTMGKLLSKFEE